MKEFNWKSDKSIVYSLTVEGDGGEGRGYMRIYGGKPTPLGP